jgi:hypothetical protein
MKLFTAICLLAFLFVGSCFGSDWWVKQTATGSASGADTNNCTAIATVNSSWPASAGDTVIAFDTIDSDPGNICNATTHTITIPSTGRYLITYGVVVTATGGGNTYASVTGSTGFLNLPIDASVVVAYGLMFNESVVMDYTASTVVTVHVFTTTGAVYVGSGNFYPTITITKLSN